MGERSLVAARLRVHADVRKAFAEKTGVGHYVANVVENLCRHVEIRAVHGKGVGFHLRTLVTFWLDRNAVYFSPESLVAPTVLGRRAVLVIHDLTPILIPHRHTRRNRLFHLLLLKIATRRAGAIIVPTARVRDDLVRYQPAVSQKIRVIHEGNRMEIPPSPDRIRSQSVLYVGTIEPRKNVPALIRAFVGVPQGEMWTLDIVGRMGWVSADEDAEFHGLISSDNRIVYHGYLSDADLGERLNSASIFCYLSESEGFGLPVVEAMSSGLPCVISDDPALLEVADGHAVVVRRGPKIVEETTAALTALMEDSPLRTELGIRGIRRGSAFSWNSHARQVAEVLEEVGSAARGDSSRFWNKVQMVPRRRSLGSLRWSHSSSRR